MKNSPETLQKRNELRRYWMKALGSSSIPKAIEKICKDCNKLGLCRWSSSFTQTGNPEYSAVCFDCQRIRYKKYSKKNRKKISLSSKEKRKKLKQSYVDYLGGCCVKCGYSKSLRALTFHHKKRSTKEFSLSESLDWSWQRIKNELDKCNLVCFNCHMELEDEYENNK